MLDAITGERHGLSSRDSLNNGIDRARDVIGRYRWDSQEGRQRKAARIGHCTDR